MGLRFHFIPTPLIHTQKKGMSKPKIGVFEISAALCVATLPWSLKLNSVCIIGYVILNGVNLARGKAFKKFDFQYFFGVSFLFWIACLWLVITKDFSEGFKHLEHSLSLIALPVIFAFRPETNARGTRFIFLSFLIACLLRYFLFLYQTVEFELIFIPDYWKELYLLSNDLFNEKVMHPTYFGLYLGMSSFICFHFYTRGTGKGGNYLWLLLVVFLLVLNLTLQAKAALIGTFLGLIIGMIFRVNNNFQKRFMLKGILIILVVGIGLMGFLTKVPNTILQEFSNYYHVLKGEDSQDSFDFNQFGTNYNKESWYQTNRIHIWRNSLKVVYNNPIIGVGTGDAEDALRKEFEKSGHTVLAVRNTNTHNQYLDFVVRYGLIGLLIIGGFFLRAIRKSMIQKNAVMLMFLAMLVTVMLTENILNRQYGVVFFSFFYGYLLLPNTIAEPT